MRVSSSVSAVLWMFPISLSKLVSHTWSSLAMSSVPFRLSSVSVCDISSSFCLRHLHLVGMSRRKASCKSFGHHDCRFKLPKIHTDIDLIDPAWFFMPLGDLLYVKSLAAWEKLLFKLKRPIKSALKRHKGRTLKSTCRWYPGEV